MKHHNYRIWILPIFGLRELGGLAVWNSSGKNLQRLLDIGCLSASEANHGYKQLTK